jgi:hypothetical protein
MPNIHIQTQFNNAPVVLCSLVHLASDLLHRDLLHREQKLAQLLAHTTALVRRRVLRPVLLSAVRRHLALALSQCAQLLAHTTALVRRRVLRPVLLAAVRRHLALATRDIWICSFLALRVVADPIQLFAVTLVLGPVLHGVALAAVQRHSAPGTLMQGRPVDCLYPARRVVALSDFPLLSLRTFYYFGDLFLGSEISMHTVTKE